MDDLSINKKLLFKQFNLKLDVTKAKDILGHEDVKVKDLFGNPNKMNKMSDIFPQSNKPEDGFLG